MGLQESAAGRLPFSWDDATAAGVTIQDGATLFTLEFTVVGSVGSTSLLSFTDSTVPREVGVNFAAADLRTENGLVTVVESVQPKALRVEYREGTFRLSVPAVSGHRYSLEYSDSLPANEWLTLPAVAGDGDLMILVDPHPASSQRFYRIRIE